MLFQSIKKHIDDSVRPFTVLLNDYLNNRRYTESEIKFLVLRHGRYKPRRYDIILDWIAANLPEIRPYFELHQLPGRITDWSKYKLHLPWLQDPVQQWSIRAYNQACRISRQCDALNIPIINRVENLINASKSNGARIIGDAGIRTPRIVKITDFENFKKDLGGLEFPLIIRDDWGHQGPMLLIETLAQLNNISLAGIIRPIAIEYINTQSEDGFYRKYRYTITGDIGIPQSIHVQKHWQVRGEKTEYNDSLVKEEKDYLNNPDPNQDQLVTAYNALELDFVAFDYSYDQNEKLVVWEVNPYPYLHFLEYRRLYRNKNIQKILAAITKMYLDKAGIANNLKIENILSS